jgi:hypothetical protein
MPTKSMPKEKCAVETAHSRRLRWVAPLIPFNRPPPPPVSAIDKVQWTPMNGSQPLPPTALLGGDDYDREKADLWGHRQINPLYVCRVQFSDGGVHPGKLVPTGRALKCNVSYGGQGSSYDSFEVATTPLRIAGVWASGPPTPGSHMLLGGHEADGRPLYVCRANYIEQLRYDEPIVGSFGTQGTLDHGVHPGKLVAGKCDVEWGGRELALDQDIQAYWLP